MNVGTVASTATGYAEVDATDSSITHVVGTLTFTNLEFVIDPTNAKVSSSVHWNPVPVAAAVETYVRGVTIVGQQIVRKAQLADKKGNSVAVRNQPVKFFWNSVEIVKNMNTAVIKISTQTGTTGSGYQLGIAKFNVTPAVTAVVGGLSVTFDTKGKLK